MAEETPKPEKPETKREVTTLEPDLKQAVLAAREFLRELEKENLVAGPIQDLVLEGVRGGDLDGGDWIVILGYRFPSPFDNVFAAGPLGGLKLAHSQVFKAFTVNRQTGRVTSMTPYEPAGH